MKEPKYKVIFSSVVKPVVSSEKDKYLAKASLEELKKFIPEIDTEKNFDLLPVAFNACVVNRINKNDDVIDAATAVEIYKSFINKPINVEHSRKNVIGVVTTAGFSEFGSDKPLTEEEASKLQGPFNVTLGGVIWRSVNEDIASIIEEAADPNSDKYLTVSASWELGFYEFEVVSIQGDSKNLEDGKTISDEKEIEEISAKLRALGGSGITETGERIYRKPKNLVLPMGIGFTESPAAEVVGVAVKKTEENVEKAEGKNKEIANNISQQTEAAVKESSTIVMKLNKIEDITDEVLKTISASSIAEFVKVEIQKANEAFVTEKTAREQELKASQENLAAIKADLENAKKQLEEANKTLKELQAANEERQNQETFNKRMGFLDETYELSADERKVIADKIKGMNDEAFGSYQKELEVLLKEKNKEFKKTVASETVVTPPATPTTPAAPAPDATVANAQTVVDKVVDGAQQTTPAAPATPSAEVSFKDRFAKAFSLKQVKIKI